MKKLKIAVLPGDGIGQEITLSALPIFNILNIPVEITLGDIGWEFWKKEGDPIPQKTWDLINAADTVLLGAITSKPEREALDELSPKLKTDSVKYVSPVIQLRQKMDLYANIRPCYSITGENGGFDFCIVRENTEGLYSGFDFYPVDDKLHSIIKDSPRWANSKKDEISCSFRLQSKSGLERLFEYSFQLANKKNYKRVTFADKPNVLRASSKFAREIFEKMASRYPDIKADILNIDAVALWLVKRPEEFGIIVAENMFGDILSDLGAGVMGGLGFAPSANIGANGCYFEPVHGSAPRVSANTANPSAMFLTIALLCEHFGYISEAMIIRNAVREVVKSSRDVTYDLGGTASTQHMAQVIIDKCIYPTPERKVSILATGNEIIQGDVKNTNSMQFSKEITALGGRIYQCMETSDYKNDIKNAIKYLLNKSDTLIISGGLGPTSDDNTRHAVAEVLNLPLDFNELTWDHIIERLSKFNIKISDSNKKQALFPRGANLYINENGTAWGCHIEWQDKHIILLPGPPKECIPMFEKYVLPFLDNKNYFTPVAEYKWLTLGAIEGEIAPKIDTILEGASAEANYRCCYPYLEIKLKQNKVDKKTINTVGDLLGEYLVSTNGNDAFTLLKTNLSQYEYKINILDALKLIEEESEFIDNKLKFISDYNTGSHSNIFSIKSSKDIKNQKSFDGTITFTVEGYINDELKYHHQVEVPNRDSDIAQYAKAYFAWQLSNFITELKVG